MKSLPLHPERKLLTGCRCTACFAYAIDPSFLFSKYEIGVVPTRTPASTFASFSNLHDQTCVRGCLNPEHEPNQRAAIDVRPS